MMHADRGAAGTGETLYNMGGRETAASCGGLGLRSITYIKDIARECLFKYIWRLYYEKRRYGVVIRTT
ncbi:hypothetical protein LPY66_15220 [Dehalobacter sp. DCM]|uniref:hypothetical protein n=1 Tax=Dehalobacter sp. DCM TaxID=2907827 RepID=UPI003081ED1A|nr:hypothetical protein LPY66_15220 [Dehalobacter sp. DCM]